VCGLEVCGLERCGLEVCGLEGCGLRFCGRLRLRFYASTRNASHRNASTRNASGWNASHRNASGCSGSEKCWLQHDRALYLFLIWYRASSVVSVFVSSAFFISESSCMHSIFSLPVSFALLCRVSRCLGVSPNIGLRPLAICSLCFSLLTSAPVRRSPVHLSMPRVGVMSTLFAPMHGSSE